MGTKVRSVAVVVALMAGMASAAADPVSRSVVQMLSDGYEVKAVSIVPRDMLDAVGTKPDGDPQVLISLQRGASIGVCQMALVNWNNQPASSLNNDKLCSVTVPGAAAPTSDAAPAEDAPAPAQESPPSTTPK